MAKYFSASTVAFYDTDIIDLNNLPEDSVLLTDEEYADLMAQQCAGYVIVAGTDGRPVAMQQICEPCSCLEHDETIATAEKLGHIKIGSGLTVEEDGTVSAQGNLRTINNNLPDETGNITPKQTGCIPMTHITNCITEIPQDINLELSDGTLTLKAGSKVYVPNGFESDGTTPKFDVVEISTDLSRPDFGSTDDDFFVYLNSTKNGLAYGGLVVSFSGTTAPDTGYFYDTTTNTLDYYNSEKQSGGYSFPLCIATRQGGTITGIKTVFNGFGYIGSTIFALPNVKGLIPNGRNADGSLNNKEFVTSGVLTETLLSVDRIYFIRTSSMFRRVPDAVYVQEEFPPIPANDAYGSWYKPSENVWYSYTPNTGWFLEKNFLPIGVASLTNFVPKLPFRALDYSDKAEVAGWAMPSDKYIDLTLGATGTSYTAPADGYFMLSIVIGTGTFMRLANSTNLMFVEHRAPSSNEAGVPSIFLPVKRASNVVATYSYTGNSVFRFYYAEGAK